MFEKLIGKDVKVKIGVISGMTETVKGKVLLIENMWMKIQVKEKIELVNLDKVCRIYVLN